MGTKEIEIIDNNNTISLYDEDDNLTLDFRPDTKEFKSTFSLNDDVYYRTELYEYKLFSNPIEVSIRLKVRSDFPPLHFVVKDGVVLESEINNEMGKDFIADLKKDIEWHKLELAGGYAQLFYILSLHPEVVPKGEYRKFLRQTEQRIKLGLSKVETRLDDFKKEENMPGFKIVEGKYGKEIWIPNREEISKKELNKLDQHARNNFFIPLFDKKSSEYCGITKNEFRASFEILKHIDKLLNEKCK